jgi:hypothetical protein
MARLAEMRTAVVRVDVDPSGELTPARLREGMSTLHGLADRAGVVVIDSNVAEMPVRRREVQLLVTGSDPVSVKGPAVQLCAEAFGTAPAAGVVTFVSRGTDDDAHGVLSGFGLTADIVRSPGTDGLDVVHVTLRKEDLERVPESRIHTALEASLNCEVRILTT